MKSDCLPIARARYTRFNGRERIVTAPVVSTVRSSIWGITAHCMTVFVLLGAAIVLYGSTVHYPFEFDDHLYIVKNPLFKNPANYQLPTHVLDVAAKVETEGLDPDLSTNFILRPFTYLTFYWNYLHGGDDPAGYRVVNIAIHGANAVLLYALLFNLFRDSRGMERAREGTAFFVSSAAAMAFVSHPFQIESVTYVVQRFTSLVAFFYLGSLLLYLLSLKATCRFKQGGFRCLSVASLALAMVSKESSITAPIVVMMMDRFITGNRFAVIARRASGHLLCLPIIPVLLIAASWAQHHGSFNLHDTYYIANDVSQPVNALNYIFTQFGVMLSYLGLPSLPPK